MADIFDFPDNLSRKGLEKMAGIKYNPDKFFHHKQTNFDRIQAMNVEELAEWLTINVIPRVCSIPLKAGNEPLLDKWRKWLEAEVDHGDTDT